MGVILFLLFVFFLLNAYAQASRMQQQQAKKQVDFVVEEVVKNCPPHKWRYLEVKDTEGKTIKWRLICDLCGPLKPSAGPARME